MSINTFFSDSINPFDILFANVLRGNEFRPINSKVDYPCDVYFNDEFLVFNIPIVGGRIDDIKLVKTDDEIRISYHRSDKRDDSVTYLYRSVVRRDFEMAWKISPKFDLENLQANYKDGLFSIQIPWAKKSLPQEVPISNLSYNLTQSELEVTVDAAKKSNKIAVEN